MLSNMLRKYIAIMICAFAMAQDLQELPFFPPYSSLAQSNVYSRSASAVGNAPIDSQSTATSSGSSIDLQSTESSSDASIVSKSTATSSSASIGSKSSSTSSGASIGLQSSATTNAQVFPHFPDPNIELFASSLIQLLKTSRAFGSFGTFTESDPYEILFDVGYPILIRDGFPDSSSADLIAQTAKDIGVLTSDLFYSTMSYALGKFLSSHGILTRNVALNVPREVVHLVEVYATASGIDDAKSVVSAVGNGFFDYIDFGDLVQSEGVWPFQLFAETLKELASGGGI